MPDVFLDFYCHALRVASFVANAESTLIDSDRLLSGWFSLLDYLYGGQQQW
jgi:hypothetical protein